MKKIIFISVLLIVGCDKNSTEPETNVFFYSPEYIDIIGNQYTGNYFPLGKNYSFNYDVVEEFINEIEIKTDGAIDTTYIDTIINNISKISFIDDTMTINLNGLNFHVYPVKYHPDSNIYYYQDTDSMIYYRAFEDASGNILEKYYPILLKKPLIVGDSWQTTGDLDGASFKYVIQESFGYIENYNYSGTGFTYVIGKESINWNNINQDALRIDNANDFTFTFQRNINEISYDIVMNMKLVGTIYLIQNIGQVKSISLITSKATYNYTLNGKAIQETLIQSLSTNAVLNEYSLENTTIARNINNVQLGNTYPSNTLRLLNKLTNPL